MNNSYTSKYAVGSHSDTRYDLMSDGILDESMNLNRVRATINNNLNK